MPRGKHVATMNGVNLTENEVATMELLGNGMSLQEVAAIREKPSGAIKTQLKCLTGKFGVPTMEALARLITDSEITALVDNKQACGCWCHRRIKMRHIVPCCGQQTDTLFDRKRWRNL